MRTKKRVFGIILAIVVVVAGITFFTPNQIKVSADTEFAITAPVNNSLRAAGYIDITWTDASSIGIVENYNVYIDGSLVATTNETSYEFYTTKVNYHKAWIQANFSDKASIYTKTVRFGVTKKGLAVSEGMGAKNAKTKELGIGWYYNWGYKPYSSYSQYDDIEYVPMVWSATYDFQIELRMVEAVENGYKYILGFNEPDMSNSGGGCDKSLDEVVALWPYFYGYDIRVGSPAYSLWSSVSTSEFPSFMAQVENHVDFVCIHCYPANWNGGSAMATWMLENVIDDTYNRYKKPIWITEYSTSGNGITQSGTSEFIKYFLQGIDERDYVERQSFFSFNAATFGGGLWNYSTGELSQSGQTYAAYGNPTTDYKTGNYVNPRDAEEPTTNEITTNESTESVEVITSADQETTVAISKPAKAKILSAKNVKRKRIMVRLKKVSGAKGYQIKYSDSKNFNGYWIKNTKKRTYYLKKLDKGTKYYIKVRAYKIKQNGKKLYGKWSGAKNVKIKK